MKKRVVYLGNIWEYPLALSALQGVDVIAILYEGEEDAEGALRTARRMVPGLAVRQNPKVQVFRVTEKRDVRCVMETVAPVDLGVIANFGIILSEETLGSAREGFVNFHPGLLPDQAGRAPIIKLLARGGGLSGLTIHAVTTQFDAGPVLATVPYHVLPGAGLTDTTLAIFRLGLPWLSRIVHPLKSS